MGSFNKAAVDIGETNPVQGSHVGVPVDCQYKWSLLQQQTYKRVSSPDEKLETGAQVHTIILDHSRRAKRIAATYAKIYLEATDVQGDPSKKGRYYWPALGAFAVKQVYCGFEFAKGPLMQLAGKVPFMGAAQDNKIVLEGMSRGNFWLFQEIAPWHLFYSRWPEDFNECIEEQDEAGFHPTVKKNLKTFPWDAEASIGKIDHFKITPDLREGLKLIKLIEETPLDQRPPIQYRSLVFLAKHEQNIILQRLTYDDPQVQRILKMQASLETLIPGMVERAVYFAAACELPEDERSRDLKVRMGYTQKGSHVELKDNPPGMPEVIPVVLRNGLPIKEEKNLFDAYDRWLFVTRVASQFHNLMQTRALYMEEQIAAIAGWSEA